MEMERQRSTLRLQKVIVVDEVADSSRRDGSDLTIRRRDGWHGKSRVS